MKYYLTIFLLTLTVITGCGLLNNPSNSGTIINSSTGIPVIANTKSVKFKIILPESTTKSPNIYASINKKKAKVTFKLLLINVGNTENPTTELMKVVSVDASGTAKTSFTSVPAKSAIADIAIENGSIGSYTKFCGALDLISGKDNIIEVVPKNSKLVLDFVVQILYKLISDSNNFVKIKTGVVSQIKDALNSFDRTNKNYDDALITFLNYLNPIVSIKSVVAGNTSNTITWDPVAEAISYNIYYKTSAGVTKSNGTKLTGKIAHLNILV